MRTVICSSLLAVSVLVGCKKAPEPEPERKAEPAQTASSVSPHAAMSAFGKHPVMRRLTAGEEQGSLSWTDPSRFRKSATPMPMRKASYEVPRAAGDAEDGQLTVFYFGAGNGGGLEANMKRWTAQFSGTEPANVERSERTANELKQHVIEIKQGTFASGMPGGPTSPKPDHALIGAIIETPAGHYFFKMTGPKKTIQGARAEFFALLDSAKFTAK